MIAVIFFHVLVALSSIALTSYAYVRPSVVKLKISYSLIGLTIASGTYLVYSAPAHMLNSCIEGLVYIAIVSVGTVAVRGKLSRLVLAKEEQ